MATSEHVIMQNEALVALAIASAIDIGKAIYETVKSKVLGPNLSSSSESLLESTGTKCELSLRLRRMHIYILS